MPNCCGVGMLTRHDWNTIKKVIHYDSWLGRKYKRNQYFPALDKQVTSAKLSRDLFKYVKDAFQSYELVYVALPQDKVFYKRATKWYLDHGFKIENKTKSKHGEYDILVLSMTKTDWSKKYAV